MLRTQAAFVQNQMKAYLNMQLELPFFSVFSRASGVAILPFLLFFETSKIKAGMFVCILVLAYILRGV